MDKQWRHLQEYLVPRLVKNPKYPNISTGADADEAATNHVKVWIKLDYGYEDLKKIVRKSQDGIRDKIEDKSKLNKRLWEQITDQKKLRTISSKISASFLTDATVEYFKKLLAAEEISSPKVETGSRYRHKSRSEKTPSRRRHTSRSESSASPGPSSNNNDLHDQYEASRTSNNNAKACRVKTLGSYGHESSGDLGDRKRKLSEDSAPPTDVRKRMRLEQEERWKEERVGIEEEMDGLHAYYDTIKDESWDHFKDIIVQMIKVLARSKYSLKEILNTLKIKNEIRREAEINQISRQVFGDSRKKQTKGVGQNDMFIYGELLKRFGAYVSKPDLITEDIAFRPVQSSSSLNETQSEQVDSMETIEARLKELDKRYDEHVIEQKIDRDYEALFRYLYYDASLKTVQAYIPLYKMIGEFVQYLHSVISKRNLVREIRSLKDDQVPMKNIIKDVGKILKMEKLPLNCKSKSGLLLSCVVEFFYHNKICLISDEAKSVKMAVDKTLPEEYQKHIFYSYVEEALQMTEKGELEGFDLSLIDSEKLSLAVRETVSFIIDCGFNLYEAISHYIDGDLNQVLKRMMKPHTDVDPEGNHAILLTRLTHDFLDSSVKRELASLPIAKKYRDLLKRRVVNLISNGQFLRGEALGKVKVKIAVPKMEQETLEPLSETRGENQVVENLISQDNMEGSGVSFIPGSVILAKVLVIPPRHQKKVFAFVHGLPNLQKQSPVRINPVKEIISSHKVEMESQTVEGETNMTVLISVKNKSEKDVAVLPKGLVIASAEVVNKSAISEDGSFSPAYCSQVIRHFNLCQDNKSIKDEGDDISFITDNDVITVPKRQRTNLKIFGHKYVTGKQDYYTVDALVEFVLGVKEVEADYSNYLKVALQKRKQIVRPRDADDLLAYLQGNIGICPQIDKSSSTNLNQKFKEIEESLEEDSNNDVILQLKEFLMLNYEMKLPQANEEVCFFLEVLEECEHSVSSLRMDLFSVSKYRDIFEEELGIKIGEKMKERGFLVGDSEDFNHLNKISMNSLESLPKPTKVSDVKSFLSFAEKFSSEIPSLRDQTDKFSSHIQGKAMEADFDWIEPTEELFQNIKNEIGGLTGFRRPTTTEGKMEFFSYASDDCISAVIVQEQKQTNDEKGSWYPVAYNSRLFTPEETKMSKIEKQAHAVIWGIVFNKDTLSQMDFNLNVTSDQLGNMFKYGNTNTEYWYKQLNDYTFTVKQIKISENPAVWLTKRDENEEMRPYARATLVTCLLNETLSLLKKNCKAKNKRIKLQTKRGQEVSGRS